MYRIYLAKIYCVKINNNKILFHNRSKNDILFTDGNLTNFDIFVHWKEKFLSGLFV